MQQTQLTALVGVEMQHDDPIDDAEPPGRLRPPAFAQSDSFSIR